MFSNLTAKTNTYTNNSIIIAIAVIVTVILLISAIVVLAVYIPKQIKNKRIILVRNNSERLKDLANLNISFNFKTIETKQIYIKYCRSKREYDNLDLIDYFIEVIKDDVPKFEKILSQVQFNIALYKKYEKQYYGLSTSVYTFDKSLKINEETYCNIERELFENEKIHPAVDADIIITKEYSSPQGRNHYRYSKTFNCNSLELFIHKAKREIEESIKHKQDVENERRAMTDALRYDILKRDNFRCVLCGASQQDGVKLHIDHIIPVSKGGKTEKSNLRTLCARCNFGKRDKYDPFGPN